MITVRRLRQFVATVRFLTVSQVRTRLIRLGERWWWRLRRARPEAAGQWQIRPHRSLWQVARPEGDVNRAHDIAAGRFEFLSVTRTDPHWDDRTVSQLWRYHLHYFEYARDLALLAEMGERDRAYAVFRNLATSWIEANKDLVSDGWHPYTISLRLVNWCESADFFERELEKDRFFAARLIGSIYSQARFLFRHLEHDVRGNHLIKNLRALIWAGNFFEGPEPAAWHARALELLRVELGEQVLADGGHFERTPGYHLQVLRDLAETFRLLDENSISAPWLESTVERMREFLRAITPPSGRLPMLKDTIQSGARGGGDSSSAFVGSPVRRFGNFLASTGYAVMRNDQHGDFLIADFGRVCPDYLPAHAHADMFSYELTLGGRPIIVDSGVYEYAKGEWRDWFRSTRAHNTVEVDGRNQSDVWDSFRVGKRARLREVRWVASVDSAIVQAEHLGYAPLKHRRTIAAHLGFRTWVIVDQITGPGGHEAKSFIHLHPDVDPATVAIRHFGRCSVSEESGWYSEQFGEKRPNRVVALTAVSPSMFGYVICSEGEPAVTTTPGVVEIRMGTMGFMLHLPESGDPRIQ